MLAGPKEAAPAHAGAISVSASQACRHSAGMGGAPTACAALQPAMYIHEAAWYMQLSTAPACNMISSCARSGRGNLVKSSTF